MNNVKRTFDRIMDAKQALEEEPWEAIVENKEAQKYLKSRKCEDECNGKVKVTTMDELTPLIGKRLSLKINKSVYFNRKWRSACY